jgi:hypothetical protein
MKIFIIFLLLTSCLKKANEADYSRNRRCLFVDDGALNCHRFRVVKVE